MTYQHKDLANGRWKELPFVEQMANIGSEVERALSWQKKNNPSYSQRASDRALELLDLALDGATTYPRRKELARLREAVADYFFGTNQFSSSENSWKSYFIPFTYAARRNY